ncbi:MAG: nickel-responsive transcriptional regulator NikR [Betaproteobacteria bacterium]|nr:nickel-responsive transcriptional regulator NikR [Betaproteobacteria bacterium]
MERITISLDESLAHEFDHLIARRGYENRSEAVRDLLRRELEAERIREGTGQCVANLSYVYNHHERDLGERLTRTQHAHHDLCVSTMHAHLDHDDCLETVILRGPVRSVHEFAQAIIAERGVRHGSLNMISVSVSPGARGHHHDHESHSRDHVHLKPRV